MALIFGVRAPLAGADPVPIGSVMVFHQEVAPDGWVKDVDATLDNAALRIVTSTAWASGKAGGDAFSTVFGTPKSSDNYTLLDADIPAHVHTVPQGDTAGAGSAFERATTVDGTVNSGDGVTLGDGAHQHGLVLDLHHVNFILCTKE